MTARLALLNAYQHLLLGVRVQHIAQPTTNGGTHLVDSPAQVSVIGLDVLGADPTQEVTVVGAIGTVASTDVIKQ